MSTPTQQRQQFMLAPQTRQQARWLGQYQIIPRPIYDNVMQQQPIYDNIPQLASVLEQFTKQQKQKSQKQQSQYQVVDMPQPQKAPSGLIGMFSRAANATKKAIGIKTNQQHKQQQYMKTGRQALAKLNPTTRDKLNKTVSKLMSKLPNLPELSQDQKVRLKMKLAPVLSKLKVITLTDEDKTALALATPYLKVKQLANKAVIYAKGATGMARTALRTGGGKRKVSKSPKRKITKRKTTKRKIAKRRN